MHQFIHTYPHTHTNTHICMHSHNTYIHVLTDIYIPTTYIEAQNINAIIDTHIYTHTYTYIYLPLVCSQLEKEMATHSSVLAWRIPGTEEPGGLLSMGSHRVRHD